jgi:hypothetical protein
LATTDRITDVLNHRGSTFAAQRGVSAEKPSGTKNAATVVVTERAARGEEQGT